MENPKPIGYRLHGIEVFSQSLKQRPSDFKGDDFSFEYAPDQRVLVDQRLILIILKVLLREVGREENLAELTTCCAFEITENFEDHIYLREDGTYNVPPEFSRMLISVSISTTRGILFSFLNSTYLRKAIFPIIDTSRIMDNLKKSEK